jgi:hypothetical protein
MPVAAEWTRRWLSMLALGCLIPLVTFAIGAGVGSYLGGVQGGYWGAGIGAGTGLLVTVVALLLLNRAIARR